MTKQVAQVMPNWDENVPYCTDRCPEHDGKRCRILGHRPDGICEPAVIAVVASVRKGECPCASDLEGAPGWHIDSCPYSDPNYVGD